jgi:hypothetical protein
VCFCRLWVTFVGLRWQWTITDSNELSVSRCKLLTQAFVKNGESNIIPSPFSGDERTYGDSYFKYTGHGHSMLFSIPHSLRLPHMESLSRRYRLINRSIELTFVGTVSWSSRFRRSPSLNQWILIESVDVLLALTFKYMYSVYEVGNGDCSFWRTCTCQHWLRTDQTSMSGPHSPGVVVQRILNPESLTLGLNPYRVRTSKLERAWLPLVSKEYTEAWWTYVPYVESVEIWSYTEGHLVSFDSSLLSQQSSNWERLGNIWRSQF